MRRSVQILCLLSVFICHSQAKNDRVTLSFEGLDLDVIFDRLSTQTGYFFSYNSDLLPRGSKYSLSVTDLPIDQFLSRLLVGTNLKYSFYKKQIIVNYVPPEQNVKRGKLFNVSGRVVDDTGAPLQDVNVFLDGTTIGTSTNPDGFYIMDRIPAGYYELVFSHIGFKKAVYTVEEYNGGSRIQRHQMDLEVSQLEEVAVVSERITNDRDNWPAFFQLFQQDLFGTSLSSQYCAILNPEVIDFTYEEPENKLIAFAHAPLEIRNDAMAYEITYYLESFERTDTDLRYRGQMKFQNDPNPFREFTKREIRSQRKKSYAGSWNHFKKALLAGRLRKDGFRIYETNNFARVNVNRLRELNERDIIVFKGNHWELDFDNFLVVVYTKEKESLNFIQDERFSSIIYGGGKNDRRNPGKQVSLLKLLNGSVRLDLNGQVVDRFALTSFGYWSWERLANLVPINYDPKYDNF